MSNISIKQNNRTLPILEMIAKYMQRMPWLERIALDSAEFDILLAHTPPKQREGCKEEIKYKDKILFKRKRDLSK